MKNHINDTEVIGIARAAGQIKSGDSVWVSGKSGLTEEFLSALRERAPELRDVTIIVESAVAGAAINSIKYNGSFRVISGLPQLLTKVYTEGDRPEFFRATAKTIVSIICRDFGVNTLVAEVLPPDADGMCALGRSGRSITASISETAGVDKQIAIINEGLEPAQGGATKWKIALKSFGMVCVEEHIAEASIA